MTGAELFVKSLEAAGVTKVFGLPGEENLSLLESIRKSSIELITTRDEQTAVFMAATYGRLTGRTGVALSTLGPGATNMVTGVAYAQLGAMPLMVITGQKPVKKSKQGKFQIIDVVGMMRPITKMAETIVSADRIPTSVYQAIRCAELERPGAVHLELAEDIADENSDANPIVWEKVRRPNADEKSIDKIVDALERSISPVIVVGASANRKLVRKQLKNLINKTGIPFVTTQMGKGVEDESSELYIGTTALSSGDYVHTALEKSDLVIMVGHDTIEKPPIIPNGNTKLAHINFYPADIDEVYKPDIEIVGDISHTLWSISENVKLQKWNYNEIKVITEKLKTDIERDSKSADFPIKPQTFVQNLRDILPKDAILSLDNGMYKIWVARNYKAYEQNTVLLDNALATMGAGLGVGMAAKMINPDKKVVVVAGDGGFMMNTADLETAKRLGLDLTVIILNDSGYGMIKWKQEGMGLKNFGLDFNNPDFVKLADSFGLSGYRPTSVDDFNKILRDSINDVGINIIDLAIDYSENAKLDGDMLQKRVLKDVKEA